MREGRDNERGATLVEAAIVYSLLFLTVFAVVEFGMAFKDWLSVSHAARQGARAGATLGDDLSADILVLRGVQDTLVPIGMEAGDQVRIFQANSPSPSDSQTYTFAPGNDCSNAPPLTGCCDWTPCPELGRVSYMIPGWDPSTRDVSAPETDRIGVEIQFQHDYITGLFGSTLDFTTVTDFQLEPQVFDAP